LCYQRYHTFVKLLARFHGTCVNTCQHGSDRGSVQLYIVIFVSCKQDISLKLMDSHPSICHLQC